MAPSMSCVDYTIHLRASICVYEYDMNFIISNADAVSLFFVFFGNISLLFFRFPEVVLFYFAFSI